MRSGRARASGPAPRPTPRCARSSCGWAEARPAYLEQAMIHEVTHIVFHDATDNPFHEPARWLNEGIATWSETRSDDGERAGRRVRGGRRRALLVRGDQRAVPDRRARRPALVRPGHDAWSTDHRRSIRREAIAADRGGATAMARPTRRRSRRAPASRPTQLYADFFADFGVDDAEPIEPRADRRRRTSTARSRARSTREA